MILGRTALIAGALVGLSAATAAGTPAYVLSNVNLRSGRATTNDIVVLIPAGSVVEATECADGWCAVTWQDKSGFTIETALDMSGRPHAPAPRAYAPPPRYVAGPPAYAAPPPPAVYYGPGYYYGPYAPAWGWRRRPWW
jgi:Bacterial SH3 domain